MVVTATVMMMVAFIHGRHHTLACAVRHRWH
jgi:hypothetical protein